MNFQVFKSNASGEWYRGEVEASSADASLSAARETYPSKNGTDEFRVVEITPEIRADLNRQAAEKTWLQIEARPRRLTKSGGLGARTYQDKRDERLASYRERCIRNGGRGR